MRKAKKDNEPGAVVKVAELFAVAVLSHEITNRVLDRLSRPAMSNRDLEEFRVKMMALKRSGERIQVEAPYPRFDPFGTRSRKVRARRSQIIREETGMIVE